MSKKRFIQFKISSFLGLFSTLASSLQIAIAILPVTGLLLRFGQNDLLGRFGVYGSFFASGANEIFSQLPLIFAIVLSIGFSKNFHGSSGFAGAVAYLIFSGCLKKLAPNIETGILGGILCGVFSGLISKKYSNIKLPVYLAFFSGRRAVPIIAGLFSVFLALFLSFFWIHVQNGVKNLSEWIIKSENIGLFFYGLFNRLLIPLGLHNILNTTIWFQLGEYVTQDGQKVTGEIARYLSGDPTAGYFMSGFFPVMMFGLPAACIAMTFSLSKENRKVASGIFLSVALTSLATGITEPVEYAFMFISFPLYCIHACLTGLSLVIMHLLHVRLGFTFSAGVIDFLLNSKYGALTGDVFLFGSKFAGYGNVLWTLIIGLLYGALYFLIFTFFIKVLKIKLGDYILKKQSNNSYTQDSNIIERARSFYLALGGSQNIKDITACATRLRISTLENTKINEQELKRLGAMGILTTVKGKCQVVVGTQAMDLCEAINTLIEKTPNSEI